MQDQVAVLKDAGVAAAFLNSSLSPEQIRLVYRRARADAYKLIYAAPDRQRRREKAALKDTRTKLARKEDVPAYVVCSNATLADMAEKAPRTMAELLRVSGVGEVVTVKTRKRPPSGDLFRQAGPEALLKTLPAVF